MVLWRRWNRLKKSRKIIVVICLAILVGILTYSFVFLPLAHWYAGTLLGVPIPESASNFHFYQVNMGMGGSTYIRFDLPPDDLPPFVDELNLYGTGMLENGHNPFENQLRRVTAWPFPWRLGWWEPNNAEVYAGGEFRYGRGEILVDMTDPELFTIHISVWH